MVDDTDPTAHRERRRVAARAAVAALSDEEIRARVASARSRRSSPEAAVSLPDPQRPLAELVGRFDLVFPIHVTAHHAPGMRGDDWIRVRSFPRDLRPGGTVWLKSDGGVIEACVRAVRLEWRDEVTEHTPGPGGYKTERGVTVVRVDPSTWRWIRPIPADVRHQQGFRYASFDVDTSLLTHLVDGVPSASHPVEFVNDVGRNSAHSA